MKESLTLRRRGVFTVQTSGHSHCGVREVQLIRYDVAVLCSTKLDSRGFLFEQRSIDNFFQSMKKTSKSCEVFSKHCAKELVKMIWAENPDCQIFQISVNLCAEPFAADMTYTKTF